MKCQRSKLAVPSAVISHTDFTLIPLTVEQLYSFLLCFFYSILHFHYCFQFYAQLIPLFKALCQFSRFNFLCKQAINIVYVQVNCIVKCSFALLWLWSCSITQLQLNSMYLLVAVKAANWCKFQFVLIMKHWSVVDTHSLLVLVV